MTLPPDFCPLLDIHDVPAMLGVVAHVTLQGDACADSRKAGNVTVAELSCRQRTTGVGKSHTPALLAAANSDDTPLDRHMSLHSVSPGHCVCLTAHVAPVLM